jgi:hypothetical protein
MDDGYVSGYRNIAFQKQVNGKKVGFNHFKVRSE